LAERGKGKIGQQPAKLTTGREVLLRVVVTAAQAAGRGEGAGRRMRATDGGYRRVQTRVI